MNIEDRLLIKNLANTANVVNSINGGMAEPTQILEKSEYFWIWRLRAPGVSIDNIKIEVKEDSVFIFQMLNEQDDVELPYLIGMLELTNKIDFEMIRAEYQDKEILVHLPFDELANGYQKDIDIIKGE